MKTNHRKSMTTKALAALAALVLGIAMQSVAGPSTRVAAALWASDELFDTVLTDTSFTSPPPQSTDVLFNFGMSGLAGQRSVAEKAPGEPGYSGGRWAVYLVTFTDMGKAIHDPDGDGVVNFELTNAEAVLHHAELGHLEIVPAGVYFECPLRPRRGQN